MATQSKNQKAIPDVKRTVGDKEYSLRYAMRAMGAIQDHFGEKSLTAAVARMRDVHSLGVQDLVAILYAGLKSRHREITEDQAMDIADEMPMEEMQQWITEAFLATMPADDKPGGDGGAGKEGADPQ